MSRANVTVKFITRIGTNTLEATKQLKELEERVMHIVNDVTRDSPYTAYIVKSQVDEDHNNPID